ncbi:T-cell ecto-ADP-ribosyltransferase 1-like isoform X3 [Thunnus maccoyii]|uniref:T-cell ecto-ADP-ribosyltransferase 1-like isoform X3 n=1 Tax=Thunnus maccoyii TaxID=8240 RepID=UPI001C4D08E7|nr:T-cell ecto-ADP-ribosyltransferase 1-like isoform X3 [Thunnus maccoyii]
MAVPCTIIMAATVLTALMPPIYCLEETREPSRDPRRHGENMETPRRDLPIVNSSSFPLDMVHNAVDDKYKGCTERMEKKVEEEYFNKENKGKFQKAWKNAGKCSDKQKDPEDKALTKNHMKAICAYTSDEIYNEFNQAVRTGRDIYGSSFKFHYLHYWLTSAIQTLKKSQNCQTTYRRTWHEFTGKVKQKIRFGAFASSSKRTNLKHFGNKTCFKIKTCSGAYLKHYSTFETHEEEVLIPPYERFKITNIIEGRGKFPDLEDCEKVFILESAGEQSNLNCKLAPK